MPPPRLLRSVNLLGLCTAGFLLHAGVASAQMNLKPTILKPESNQPTTAPTRVTRFDPARHMGIAEVRPGMKGYGLTVYAGSEVKKFNVEVIAIIRNSFGPGQDVILINCIDDYIAHTGPVEGMSGSPIFLTDAAGKDRMIGAFAYGWDQQKDPVAGVQPIENMLGLEPVAEVAGFDTGGGTDAAGDAVVQATWSLADANVLESLSRNRGVSLRDFFSGAGSIRAAGNYKSTTDTDRHGLKRLSIPLALSMRVNEFGELADSFRDAGLMPMSGGNRSGGTLSGGMMSGGILSGGKLIEAPDHFEPGGTLIAPMITGDLDAAAVGTVTEVIPAKNGQPTRVYGFGHPFNGDGPVRLPMATGTIATIIATNSSSFKLGSTGKVIGTLDMDSTFGIAGDVGPIAPMVPLKVNFTNKIDGSARTFNYQLAPHPQLLPRLAAMAVMSSAMQRNNLPPLHTLDYKVSMQFGLSLESKEAPRVIEFSNTQSSLEGEGLLRQVAGPILAMSENPFGRRVPRSIVIDATLSSGIRVAELRGVSSDRTTYRPGEDVALRLNIRKFRSSDATIPAIFALPADLADGKYTLFVSDAQTHTQTEFSTSPQKFDATSPDEVAAIITEFSGKRNDAVYIRLTPETPRADIAIGRTSLPGLPASIRSRLSSLKNPDLKPTMQSFSSVIATDMIVSGQSEIVIVVDRKAKRP